MRELFDLIPEQYRKDILQYDLNSLEEIRMRVGQPLLLVLRNKEVRIWPCITAAVLEQVVSAACHQSIYSYSQTLRNGYITIDGGHRIGICGFGVVEDSGVQCIRKLTSLNIRIAKQIFGCASKLYSDISESTLIIGPPGSGKTTLLRDLIRLMSDKEHQTIGVADERGEICGGITEQTRLEIGSRTDVLVNIPKAVASMMLLRTMHPRWIAMDEITAASDVIAMDEIAYCGVSLIATAHALELQDLWRRPLYRDLMEREIFQIIVVLKADKTYEIMRYQHEACGNGVHNINSGDGGLSNWKRLERSM